MSKNKRGKTIGFQHRKPFSVVSPVETIMLRIENASPESPIAVFISDRILGGLVAVFGSTVKTKEIAIEQNQNFVGMFDKNCDLKSVKVVLDRATIA